MTTTADALLAATTRVCVTAGCTLANVVSKSIQGALDLAASHRDNTEVSIPLFQMTEALQTSLNSEHRLLRGALTPDVFALKWVGKIIELEQWSTQCNICWYMLSGRYCISIRPIYVVQ